ncbi:hypothetical protein FNF28_07638 [Cafeteria roenbergensis]|uniref:Uncharacterized protein n=1 Tax=Cafeteria roenbergensis TaxID=33653 RepID=A0A5A8C2I3_CAFRO|nr:hypothetical protein FNF28_07638 [Cafeteria roenbergensis]
MNQLVLEMAERDLFNSLRPHLRREKVMPDSMSTGPIRRDFLKALARKWNLHKEPGFWSKHRDMLRLAMVLAEHGAARDLMRKESQARTAVATSVIAAGNASPESRAAAGMSASAAVSGLTAGPSGAGQGLPATATSASSLGVRFAPSTSTPTAGGMPASRPLAPSDKAAGIRALRRALRPYTGEGFAGQSDNSDSLLYLSRQQPKSSARDYATGRRQDESEPEEEAEDDETRLDCLAALCNLTAVAASGAGLQSHFQAEEEAARSGATAPDAGGSAAGAAAADDDEDGGAGAGEAPDAVPEPVLEPGVVGTLADFARTMGAGTAVDPADMELRCMLVTALLNISATRPFQARAVAEGAVPALMALMVPVTRQRARRGNAVSLSAAAAAMAAAEADDPAEAQRGSATGKGSPASNGSRVSPVGDVDADVDVGQAEGVGAGTADPAARGAADVSGAPVGDKYAGQAVRAPATSASPRPPPPRHPSAARSGLVEGDDSDAKEDDEVAFAAAVGTGRAGGLAGDDDDADDYGDDEFTADDVGKAGSPGTAAAAAAAAVGEEQDEEERARDAPPAERRDGSAGSGEDDDSAQGSSSDSAERLTEEESFALRRSSLALCRLDGLLAVLVAVTMPPESGKRGLFAALQERAPRVAARVTEARTASTWDDESYLAHLAVYNASCHHAIRRTLLKLRGTDVLDACRAVEAGNALRAVVALAAAHASGGALPTEAGDFLLIRDLNDDDHDADFVDRTGGGGGAAVGAAATGGRDDGIEVAEPYTPFSDRGSAVRAGGSGFAASKGSSPATGGDATAGATPGASAASEADEALPSLSLPVLVSLVAAVERGAAMVRRSRLPASTPDLDSDIGHLIDATAADSASVDDAVGDLNGDQPSPRRHEPLPPRRSPDRGGAAPRASLDSFASLGSEQRSPQRAAMHTPAILSDGYEAPPGAPLSHLCLLSFSLATVRNLSAEHGYQARLLAAGCLPRVLEVLQPHLRPGQDAATLAAAAATTAATAGPAARARARRGQAGPSAAEERARWDCPYPLHCVADAIHALANLAHDPSCRVEIAKGGSLAALVPVAEDAPNSVLAVALVRAQKEAVAAYRARADAERRAREATEHAARLVAEYDAGAMTGRSGRRRAGSSSRRDSGRSVHGDGRTSSLPAARSRANLGRVGSRAKSAPVVDQTDVIDAATELRVRALVATAFEARTQCALALSTIVCAEDGVRLAGSDATDAAAADEFLGMGVLDALNALCKFGSDGDAIRGQVVGPCAPLPLRGRRRVHAAPAEPPGYAGSDAEFQRRLGAP